MAYTYDPSKNIQQGFQQAASGIGNIFTQIIAQQQRDYSLAENTLNNVEALKKNIGIWGTKEVTDGANNLLGQVSSAINKNGKLDYSKLGQVRQEISNLADLKTGYDVFGKQFDRLVQVGAANKENLTSFESFYKNLVGLAADKKLIANPNDLATAMNNVLEDHINTSKMGITAIKNNLSVNPITGMYVDPKTKMEVKYSANVFDGVTVGADGKLIKPTDPAYYQALAAKIKASDPAAFDAQRKKLSKIGQSDIPDADIVKSWFDSMPAGEMKPVSMKGERDVQIEEAQLQKLGTEAKYQPQIIQAQLGQTRASTNLTNTQAALAREQLKMYEQPQTLADYKKFGIQFDDNGVRLNLGGSVAFDLVKPDGTTMKVGASEIYSKGGKKYLKYYVPNASKDLDEQIRTGFQGSTAKEIPLPDDFAQSQTYTNLQNALMGNKTGKKALLSNALKYLPSAIDGYKPNSTTAKYSSGQIEGDTIYLSKVYQGQEANILSKYNVKRAVYID